MDDVLIWWLGCVGGAAAVTAFVARRWVWLAMLAYLASPVPAALGLVLWEAATRPGAAAGIGTTILGLVMVSAFVVVPWIGTCLLGFAIGLVPRWLLRRAVPPVQAVPVADWRPIHVGLADDPVAIAGVELWKQPWRPVALPRVMLPHPAHPSQTHPFDVYDVGARFASHRFAAGELSNGVWGFYVPASAAVAEEETVSGDGSLRYVRRRHGPPAFNSSAVTLSDVATGAVYFDGAGFEYAGIHEHEDGTLMLRIAVHQRSAAIDIDPVGKVFRLSGDTGTGRPLALLQGALSEALFQDGASEARSEAAMVAPPRSGLASRSLIAILIVAALAIAVAGYLSAQLAPAMPQITPMPRMPGAKG